MSITSLLKSLRDRIRRMFHKSESVTACAPTRETIPTITSSEVDTSPYLMTINDLAKKYNTNRGTIRYRLASSGVTPVAKVTSPRLQYIYSTDTFGPLFAKFPSMKENKDGIAYNIQA